MKNESPHKQLQTVPLTAAGLAAAQASAAALSKAHSRRESNPPKIKPEAASSPRPPAARPLAPARKTSSRGVTITMAAIGLLAIACAGAAWSQRTIKPVVASAGSTAPAIKEATPPPAAQPAAAENAVGFVVASRPSTPPGGPAAPAEVKIEVKAEAPVVPAPVPAPVAVAEAAPEPPGPAKRITMRPRTIPDPAPKADPPAREPKAKPPERTASAAPPEAPKAKPPERTASVAPPEAPKPAAAAAAPSSVDAILQQQLKSAIP